MIPEIGFFSLITAFFYSVVLSVNLFYQTNKKLKSLVIPISLLINISFFSLVYSFVIDDFSVLYVFQHSNSSLPLLYKISATWSAHEGSFLLWIWVLSLWILFLSLNKTIDTKFLNKSLSVLGGILAGFILFILKTSNPFERILLEYPLDGKDLNPMLQDIGLAIHPPILYIGYVGSAIPFAFTVIALLNKNNTPQWCGWLKSWVIVAWSFLTLGICLGSWWAYYELGWGGWWFWDPVENASFMPWLSFTALLHSLIASQRRKMFFGWSAFLSILTFSLSLLGTFLVRSGVVSSVHSFASDPERGIFILQYLSIVIGIGLFLFAIRGKYLVKDVELNLVSKEMGILINNLLLLCSVLTILCGTLYPLFYEFIYNKQISVGYIYFNKVFIPIAILLITCMTFFPYKKWYKDKVKEKMLGLCIVVISILMNFYFSWMFVFAVNFSILTIFLTVNYLHKNKYNVTLLPMAFGHIGLGISIIAISILTQFEIENDFKLTPGEKININRYTVHFNDVKVIAENNYVSFLGNFDVSRGKDFITTLYPEKRIFVVSETPMTETAIYFNPFEDIYIALGENLPDKAWTVRVYYKPFIRFIWLGGLLMAIGGGVSLFRKQTQKVLIKDLAYG